MSVQEWSIVVGVVDVGRVGVGAVDVHGPRQAGGAGQPGVVACATRWTRRRRRTRSFWSVYARHEARLETHQVQIAQIGERLRDLLE